MLLVGGGVSFPSLYLATLNARSVKWSHQGIGVWREQLKDTGTAECLSPTWVMDRVAGVSSSSIHISRCAPNGTIPGAPSWHDPWSLVPLIPSHSPIPDFQRLISSWRQPIVFKQIPFCVWVKPHCKRLMHTASTIHLQDCLWLEAFSALSTHRELSP